MGCVAPGGIIPEENSSNTGDWEQSQQIAQLPAPGDLYPNDTCDGIDNDGDTRVDESCYCTPGDIQDCYIGAPDHAGVGACALGRQECFLVGGEFLIGGWGACTDSVQATLELCGNSVDEDCDGVAEACDDPTDPVGSACHVGDVETCYPGPDETENVGRCTAGLRTCGPRSTWSACDGALLPSEEICGNQIDDDCDGADLAC